MPVTLPKPLTDGTTAYGSEVRANDDAIAGKFTEGANGIADADISSSAAISGLKIATTAGRRVPTAAIEDLAVTTAKVNDLAVTTAKLAAGAVFREKINPGAVSRAQTAIGYQSQPFTVAGVAFSSYVGFTLTLEVSAGNYYVNLSWLLKNNSTGAITGGNATVTPGTPIPSATNTVLGIYVNTVGGLNAASNTALTGNVSIVYIPNT